MTDSPASCGYVKESDGEPCQLPGTRSDGRCHHHTEIDSERANGGRPSKLDDRRDDILTGARQGMTVEGCARLAGVSKDTLYRWINEYDDFSDAFNRARAQGELKHIRSVNDSGSRFILERSFGYTKTEKREIDAEHEHTGEMEMTGFEVTIGGVDSEDSDGDE